MQVTRTRVALAGLAAIFAVSIPALAADQIPERIISASGVSIPHPIDNLDTRIMAEYGTVQMARRGVVLPPAAMFGSEQEGVDGQSQVAVSSKELVLQTPAADALAAAPAEARCYGLKNLPPQPRCCGT